MLRFLAELTLAAIGAEVIGHAVARQRIPVFHRFRGIDAHAARRIFNLVRTQRNPIRRSRLERRPLGLRFAGRGRSGFETAFGINQESSRAHDALAY